MSLQGEEMLTMKVMGTVILMALLKMAYEDPHGNDDISGKPEESSEIEEVMRKCKAGEDRSQRRAVKGLEEYAKCYCNGTINTEIDNGSGDHVEDNENDSIGGTSDDSQRLTCHIYAIVAVKNVCPFTATYDGIGISGNGKPNTIRFKYTKSSDEVDKIIPAWAKGLG